MQILVESWKINLRPFRFISRDRFFKLKKSYWRNNFFQNWNLFHLWNICFKTKKIYIKETIKNWNVLYQRNYFVKPENLYIKGTIFFQNWQFLYQRTDFLWRYKLAHIWIDLNENLKSLMETLPILKYGGIREKWQLDISTSLFSWNAHNAMKMYL